MLWAGVFLLPAIGCTTGTDLPPAVIFDCGDGDAQLDLKSGGCIYVVSTPTSWPDARTACQEAGAELVKILDETRNQQILDLANQVITDENPDFWLLGNDNLSEGNFVWGGETTPFEFEVWRDGEPNNGGAGEDCVAIEADNPLGEWDDRNCASLQPYFCERPARTVPDEIDE